MAPVQKRYETQTSSIYDSWGRLSSPERCEINRESGSDTILHGRVTNARIVPHDIFGLLCHGNLKLAKYKVQDDLCDSPC